MTEKEKKKVVKLSAKQAAEKLECSRATITAMCRKGIFPNAEKHFYETGGVYWLIPESDLEGKAVSMGRPKKD